MALTKINYNQLKGAPTNVLDYGAVAGSGGVFDETIAAANKVAFQAAIGITWGSGAPTLSAVKGCLYLRTDGSGINDRLYVNTNGCTTWTAVVTVA